ncbi:MAG: trigger factor [Candidatus Sungbacteria bacterium]|uniref:Trigger factor n=2 Tax=Candidatus Sungiibacteriota bacterium TaxID=2750080 RepID=A0A931YDF7_9BACT|nr:trigger factor [Candidatus Sungbacteria bacterium]
MDIQTKDLPKSQIEITITLSTFELEPYLDAAARELSRINPIKGFRPGFAPKDIVIKELGKEKTEHLAFDLAVREKLGEIILEKKINLVGEPKVSKVSAVPGGGLAFTVVVSAVPQIDPGDYKKIKVPLAEIKLEDKEVADVLEDIRKSRAQNTNVARAAQKGDRVEVDFSVKKNGQLVDGGESKQHPFVLGEGHFIEGFEDNLVGLKEGESKNFSLTVPADYHNKDLAAQKIDFEVKINLVQERKLPELNDDFAKSLSRFTSFEEFRNNVVEGLKNERELKAKEKRRAVIVEELIKNIGAELPDELVQMELGKMTAELSESLGRMNLTLENYLGHINKTPEQLKDSWLPQAEKRVKAALALKHIAQKENVMVDDAEVEERLNQLMRSAPPLAPGQNLDLTALRGYVKNVIRNEKVFELLEAN